MVGINGLYIINLQNYQTEIKYQFKTKDSSRKMIELEENNLLISNSEGIDVLNYSKNEIKLIEEINVKIINTIVKLTKE